MKKRISYTNQPSLFDKIIAGYVPEQEEKPMQLNINDYDKSETNKTKSLRNLNDIFFSKEFDYQDYKQSLKYNNKNLKKIGFENIKDPHPKLIKRLVKIDLSGLIELKFKDIQVHDDKFEIFDKFGGIQGYCKNLKHLQLSCPHLTTVGLKHCFKGPQNLITLDLSHSQIDDMGIQYLCGFKWNHLDQFILQWCKRLKNLSDMAVYSENFPQLRVTDIRFSYAENSTVSSMLNSSLVYTLSQIRVYGTAVKMNESRWNSQYIISQLQQKLQTQKLQQLHLKNDSVAVDSTNDKMQVRTNVIVNIDTEEKAYMTYSWKITNKEANISIREGPEQPEDRSDKFGQLFLFLQKEWQLRESLIKFSIQLNEVICKDNNVNAILNTVGEYAELLSVNFNMKNQKILKPVTYYYLFQQMAKLKELQYLAIDLQNCNIEVNNVFLKKILTSIQALPYLYKFYLNLFECKYMYLDDLKLFAYQTINSMKNPYLNKTHLMLTCNENLAYTLEDIANLYTSDYKKTINLNNELMVVQGTKNHRNTENRRKNIFYHQELHSQTSNDDFAKKQYKKLYIKYMIHDDSYIFLQDLGSGGFGKVVKALNDQQEEVAVKV
ncbi:hypothetical protein pb186bvf_002971 [Paramecium bursaria]